MICYQSLTKKISDLAKSSSVMMEKEFTIKGPGILFNCKKYL